MLRNKNEAKIQSLYKKKVKKKTQEAKKLNELKIKKKKHCKHREKTIERKII